MFGSFSEFERNVITERTTEGRWRKAEGNHACGEVSLGYRKNGEGKLEPDPETPPIVQRIFQLREEGESLRSIAERLNNDDVDTKSGGE
jgi:site-specific DNA recombinase